jgi:hypothetical protein
MRLLKIKDDGELCLTEHPNKNIPKYAILSHTWGNEEVTFEDLTAGGGTSKYGFKKIKFCEEQAARDELRYFWVDTCCINSSNYTELSEALNSMFRWYRDASKCYVYLSDVSIQGQDASNQSTWELAFRKCRWFTRGWTLQELIAPATVEFFSLEGKRLCDKGSHKQLIEEITGIPGQALQGSISHFSVSERLFWAENRETTREEDEAYSLMGIFDVFISPIYGEGKSNARIRLQDEINKRSKGTLIALQSRLLKA